MTTGSSIFDARAYSGNPDFGYQGKVASKVWGGDDSPPRPPKRYLVLHPRFESSQLKKNGKPFVIPEYRVRIAEPSSVRARSEHPYSMIFITQRTGTYSDGLYPFGYGNVSAIPNPAAGVAVPSDSAFSSNDSIVLVNRLRARMMGSSFDPAAFLATSHQSLQMIASSAYRLRIGMSMMKRGRVKDALDTFVSGTRTRRGRHRNYTEALSPQGLAQAQLETSYGWLPLLSDAYSGAQYVAHNTELPQKHSVRSTFRRPIVVTSAQPGNFNFPQQESFVFGQLIARMTDGFSFTTTQLAGLDDPASMAWEALPWSFVADWFIPIQNFLQARAFARRVSGTFILTTGYRVRTGAPKGISPYNLVTYSPFSQSRISMTRSISSSLDVPYPKPRPLTDVPSWRRCLNAVSLLVVRHGSTVS